MLEHIKDSAEGSKKEIDEMLSEAPWNDPNAPLDEKSFPPEESFDIKITKQ